MLHTRPYFLGFRPIEAVYVFPVEESAAVTAFEAEVEGRTITTKVKAKKEAAQEYSDAVQAGHTAVLLEEDKPDVFTIKIGQLKPGSGAKIRLIYASELPVDEGSVKAVRLTVPTTIAPRFVPYTDGSEAAKKLGGIQYSLDTPAPLKVSILAVMKNKIAALESPSHKLLNEEMKLEDGRFVMESRLRSSCDEMDRDLIVLVTTEVEQRAAFFFEQFEKDGKVTSAGMVSLVPSFRLKESRSELIFVVDRSGSMGGGFSSPGSGIDQAKKALGLFLPSMPADCWFNIYSFGSTFESLFPKSIPYDDTSLATAKAHVAEMTANYGGTVILNPLRAIFKEEHAHKEASRQIFVLTDGSVSNTDEVGVFLVPPYGCFSTFYGPLFVHRCWPWFVPMPPDVGFSPLVLATVAPAIWSLGWPGPVAELPSLLPRERTSDRRSCHS